MQFRFRQDCAHSRFLGKWPSYPVVGAHLHDDAALGKGYPVFPRATGLDYDHAAAGIGLNFVILAADRLRPKLYLAHNVNYAVLTTLKINMMEWIPWDDALTTGHSVLDADHKILIALFNQLTDSVKRRSSRTVCSDMLAEIIEHAREHFALEERLMTEHRYPKYDQHAEEHNQLIKRALNFRAKFDAGSPGSHIDVIHFPEDWLTFHIFGADKELGEFLSATR